MYVCVAGISRGVCDGVPNFCCLGCPHCEHLGADGGPVCLPPHPPSSLVRHSVLSHGLVLLRSPLLTDILSCVVCLMLVCLASFLRVEFQSKFYKGEGYAFAPLTFKHIINGEEDEV